MILCRKINMIRNRRKNEYNSESHSVENTFHRFGFWHSAIVIVVEDDNVFAVKIMSCKPQNDKGIITSHVAN